MLRLVDTTYGQKIAHLYIIKPGYNRSCLPSCGDDTDN